ncbi:Hemicentin-1 [Aphelenchoides fujianensis]|nr:Hemicentin-1 [Aphelenchoides fujianensis]
MPIHMDCTVIPINDPKLQIEWYFNGQPLRFSNRIKSIFEFGYCALEFKHTIEEDSGLYVCRAWNEAGEAETSLQFDCRPQKNLYLESQHEESYAKIYEMENRVIEKEPSPELVFPPPTFTQNLQNADGLVEGESIRFECRLQPINDPTLKVSWTLNGNPLSEANRYRLARNVDHNVLDIIFVVPEDEGLLECHAVSDYGQATTSATLKVQGIDALQLDTKHEESWRRVQELEAPKPEPEELPEPAKEPPRFTVQLTAVPETPEGTPVNCTAQYEPTNDNTLVVEWLKDGAPLGASNRIKTAADLGNVALSLLHPLSFDSGVYTCVIRNEVGEARTDTNIQIIGHDVLFLDPQHEGSWRAVQALEAPKEKPEEAEPAPPEAPQFTQSMESLQRIETQPALFSTRVQPRDAIISWEKDGQPLGQANRFRQVNDFGLVQLHILHCVASDQGTYTCIARNDAGEARIDAQLEVEAHGTLFLDPQNAASWQRVQELEAPKERPEEEAEAEVGPPHFVTQLQNVTDIVEGNPAHFEAVYEPISANSIVTWYFNGRPLRASNKHKVTNSFGLVTLDIDYVLAHDVGDYMVKVANAAGEDQTQASLDCEKRPNIIDTTLHEASYQRIQEIEAPKERPATPPPVEYAAPQFTAPLVSQADVQEGADVIFEGRVVPVNDPDLQLQWFKDDQPLGNSNRHRITFDFGSVALFMTGVTSLDNGVYSCKAVNKQGAAISNASLSVGETEGIYTNAFHEESYRKILELEGVDKNPRLEYPEQEFGKPVWVQTFQNVDLQDEGDAIQLQGYVDPADDPDLRVEWQLNGVPLQNSNRHRQEFQFGQVQLTIAYPLAHDSGVYTCRAYNLHGEASTSCTVTVAGYESLLLDTLHQPSWERIQELEAPRIIEEVEMVEEKEKPRFLTQLEDAADVPEGTPIKLEATFQPARDNDLQVFWELNGSPLPASQLIRTRSELGWACLIIDAVNLDHQGVITLKIRNTEGEAATSAKISIAGIGDILDQTTHEESWQRIQELEAPKEKEPTPPPAEYDAPSITTQIADQEVDEGEPSVFEAVYAPTQDNTVVVQWFRNDQPLANGNKYAITNDFGTARLALGWTYPEDEGVIQVKITNSKGEAVSSATLKCHAKDALLLDTTHPDSVARIEELEAPKEQPPEPEPAPLVPPKFTSPLSNPAELNEGQSAHFEATVEPWEGLQIEWFLNGAPLANSNRFKILNDFGYAILNINGVTVHDQGEWKVVATNAAGTDSVSSNLTVVGKEGIASEPINEQSLARIEQIEQPKAPRPEAPAREFGAPSITAQLTGGGEFDEGDAAYLEAKYSPTDDPSLTVAWFKDGQPLGASNKHKIVDGFGIATCSFKYVLAQDSGEYSIVVTNAAGEATSGATLQVNPKESLVLDPLDANKARAVQELEDLRNRRPEEVEAAEDERMPVFVEPLSAPIDCQSGDHVQFHCRYEPITSNVAVQWYLNDRPLINASRVKTLNSLGYIVLEINPAYPEDSGQYSCRIRNKNGEAVTSTSLNCTPTETLLLDTQKEASWRRVQELEAPKAPAEEQPEVVHAAPRFTTQLQSPGQLREGVLLNLSATLEPIDDNQMVVEWLHNGEPVRDSNRHKKIFDFGRVVLELMPVEPQDNGTWTCRASNASGQAETSVEIEVVGDSGVSYEWVSPGERRERIDQLEEYINRPKDELVQPDVEFDPPQFTQQLTDLGEFTETDAASFICVLEPIGDPSMKIEWTKDGQPLPFSNRFHIGNDFGVCSLNVKHLIAQDSGQYTCTATSDKGTATTSGTINVQTIIETEQPQIVQPLVQTIDADEGESVHLETRVTPINDPKLEVRWRLRVTNDKGEVSTTAHVVINAKPSLEFGAQAPGSTAENIEHHLAQFTRSQVALTEDDAYDPKAQRAPEFKTQLLNIGVEEGQYARFETQVAPFSDPYMRIEFLKDGKLVPIGHRLRSTHEMGYTALDFLYTLPVDTGEYTIIATNKHGQASVSAKLACAGKKDVLMETQIPQGLKVRDIKKKEDNLHWIETSGQQERRKEAPQFSIKPRNVQVQEGQPARFECAVSGHPRPKVIWYINGNQALHGARCKLNYDGVHYLTVSQARISDAGTIEAIAKNSEGEVLASATLDVFQRDDFRQQKLRQAQQKTSDELQARAQQWQTETLGQLGEDFKRAPKADATKLLKVERNRHPVEPLETEELVQKFTRAKDEEYYDKLNSVERQKAEFGNFELEPVQLKPGQIQRYQPEPEQMEQVALRGVQRPEGEREPSPPPEWAVDPKLGEPKGRFNQLNEPEREANIPARDQVKLKGQKPKPADEKPPVEHVQIEEDRAKLRAVQQGPEIEPERIVPHKQQVQIRQKYAPKPVDQGEHVYVDAKPLKDTPDVVKSELERSTISNKPQPTKMVESQKAAPSIQNQLQPIQAEIGRSAVFAVNFSGDPPVKVQWFQNGREIRSAFDTQIKTNDGETRLELSKLKKNHEGDYTVRLSNVGGQCESSANLIVNPATSKGAPPEFKQRMSDQRAQQGQNVKFTCQVTSGKPRTVQWFKDGKPLPNDDRFQLTDTESEVALELTKLLPQDAGVYEVVVVAPGGEARTKARLSVNLAKTGKEAEKGLALVAPRFNTPLKPAVVAEGQSAEFRANFVGDPEPMISWFRNNEPILKSRQGYEMGHANGDCWLKIASVGQDHVAEFKVEASNPAGKASSVANLVLKPSAGRIHPIPAGAVGSSALVGETTTIGGAAGARGGKAPQILQKLTGINARTGENVKFVLQFDGTPAPEISWTFNGKPLTDGKEHKISVEQNKAILQIARVQPAHAGAYACTLKNASGSAKSETKLNVQSR